jgi:hypothetical protein
MRCIVQCAAEEFTVELKSFIVEAISSIVEAVKEAQERAITHQAFVNPGGLMRSPSNVSTDATWDNSNGNYARLVSFDIAVTSEEGTRTNGNAGLVIGVLGLATGGASENKQLAVSRVQFSVPILFPTIEKAGARASTSRPPGTAMSD